MPCLVVDAVDVREKFQYKTIFATLENDGRYSVVSRVTATHLLEECLPRLPENRRP